MNEGYNWRNTLKEFAAISGILAGFCVALIGIVLNWSLADLKSFYSLTLAQVGVLFLGISTAFFISASECLLHSKTYDVFECTKEYRDWVETGKPEKDWPTIYVESTVKLRSLYDRGKLFYNSAIFLLYLGLLFIIVPYNLCIAITIGTIGILLQLCQLRSATIPKAVTSALSKRRKLIAAFILTIVLTVAFWSVFWSVFWAGHSFGQLSVVDHIIHNESVVQNLASTEVLTKLREKFPVSLNYTELIIWESARLNFTQDRIVHTDPLEILDYGKGACGEFSIVYVAICLANNIPARLLVTGYVIPGIVDHTWAEVNPAKDSETWIHIDPSDSAVGVQLGKSIDELTSINNPLMYQKQNYRLVLAFEITREVQVSIIDRTTTYSPTQ